MTRLDHRRQEVRDRGARPRLQVMNEASSQTQRKTWALERDNHRLGLPTSCAVNLLTPR